METEFLKEMQALMKKHGVFKMSAETDDGITLELGFGKKISFQEMTPGIIREVKISSM